MRYWRTMCAVLAMLTLALAGCTREVAGFAQPDSHPPGVTLSPDGYGISVGLSDAPVQLEIFTEPQCEHCADFQATYGEGIKSHVRTGLLAVVYRPLTFFDDEYDTDYSAAAANALFLAAAPTTTAATFQSFVEDLWANQELSWHEYTADDLADLALDSGLGSDVVNNISAGAHGVDAAAMDEANSAALENISNGSPGTPTVYNLKLKEVVDISDPDWLNLLMRPA
jgi:protein-disulfide isomerase